MKEETPKIYDCEHIGGHIEKHTVKPKLRPEILTITITGAGCGPRTSWELRDESGKYQKMSEV